MRSLWFGKYLNALLRIPCNTKAQSGRSGGFVADRAAGDSRTAVDYFELLLSEDRSSAFLSDSGDRYAGH